MVNVVTTKIQSSKSILTRQKRPSEEKFPMNLGGIYIVRKLQFSAH